MGIVLLMNHSPPSNPAVRKSQPDMYHHFTVSSKPIMQLKILFNLACPVKCKIMSRGWIPSSYWLQHFTDVLKKIIIIQLLNNNAVCRIEGHATHVARGFLLQTG